MDISGVSLALAKIIYLKMLFQEGYRGWSKRGRRKRCDNPHKAMQQFPGCQAFPLVLY